MLFNTYTYALFLPLVFLACLGLPLRGRQVFLLAASYVFYCWETPIYGVLLLISTFLDFSCGLGMEQFNDRPAARRTVLIVSLAGNLLLLGFFKYADFLGQNFVGLGHLLGFQGTWAPLHFLLPVGISFYTFQTMSYSIEVYRRQIKAEHDLISFALFVSFFPQLVAGPIERASHLLPQLKIRHQVTKDDLYDGVTRIVFGLFKKMVIADRFSILVDRVFSAPDAYPTLTVWLGVLCFGGQIYFDFAGYSDIAIGSARLFGVRIMENFRHPLVACSMADFWNRWHISLTSWFRDYLFFPLGGFRKGGARAILNGCIVLTLCGLWHGASWHFVLWGVFHSIALALYYLWKFWQKKHRRKTGRKWEMPMLPAILLTYLVTSLSLVFFRSGDLYMVGRMFRALAGLHEGAVLAIGWYTWAFAALWGVCALIEGLLEYSNVSAKVRAWPWYLRAAGLALIVVLLALGSVNNAAPYIYFQF